MKSFLTWLFNDTNGHFCITVLILAGCGIAAVCGAPGASGAVLAVWPIVLAKLK